MHNPFQLSSAQAIKKELDWGYHNDIIPITRKKPDYEYKSCEVGE
jgi:hypothetical protein